MSVLLTFFVTLGLASIVGVAPASAHVGGVSHTCSTVSVDLSNYATKSGRTNHVTVWINGTKQVDKDFGSQLLQ